MFLNSHKISVCKIFIIYFLVILSQTIVRHDLVQELNKISPEQLKSEMHLQYRRKDGSATINTEHP